MAQVTFKNVTKTYPRKPGQQWLKSYMGDKVRSGESKRIRVLDDVSFSIPDGDSVAIIGRNGAGKSTVLNLIAGLLPHDTGTVHVEGRVSALLDLGAGFHYDLTGRENLIINAALNGFSRAETKSKIGEIVEFSGLGAFIDQPIRTYSSGMTLRLAFSVAVSLNPDILLVDEVLAVGDAPFQARCIERIQELKKAGRIFICVSHAMAVDQLCGSAIWIEQGSVRKVGPVDLVLAAYYQGVVDNCEIAGQVEVAEVKAGVPGSRDPSRAMSI